jgi:hypothetical protein
VLHFLLRLLFEVGSKLEARELIFKEEMLPFLLKESLDCFNDDDPGFASSCWERSTALDGSGRRVQLAVVLLLLSSFDGVLLISVHFWGRSVGDRDGGEVDRGGNSVSSPILMRLRASSSSYLISSSHKLMIPIESDAPLSDFGPAAGLF